MLKAKKVGMSWTRCPLVVHPFNDMLCYLFPSGRCLFLLSIFIHPANPSLRPCFLFYAPRKGTPSKTLRRQRPACFALVEPKGSDSLALLWSSRSFLPEAIPTATTMSSFFVAVGILKPSDPMGSTHGQLKAITWTGGTNSPIRWPAT